MGMKPRKTSEKTVTKMNASTKKSVSIYGKGLRDLLRAHKVPKKELGQIWDNLDDYKHADADLDVQWFVGWFKGVSEALDCNPEDLYKL